MIRRRCSHIYRSDRYSQRNPIIWPVWLNDLVFVYELKGCGFEFSCSHLNFRFHACLEQRISWHWRNYRECGFTRKYVHYMIRRYSHIYRSDRYSQRSPIIWPVLLNDLVFVYELKGCGFEFSCSHLKFRIDACFEEGLRWHSGIYRVWIHSETRIWHDKNIQWKAQHR